MATYYVRKTGNDTTGNGLTAATAFATVGKALTTGLTVDNVYVGAGVYREVVGLSLGTSPSSGAPLSIIADNAGQYTGDAGDVVLSGYTSGDTATWNTTNSATLELKGYNWITVDGFRIVSDGIGCLSFNTTFSNNSGNNITVRNCDFVGSLNNSAVIINGLTGASNILVEKCSFLQSGRTVAGQTGGVINIELTKSASADYNAGITVRDCEFIAYAEAAVYVASLGASTFKGGGITVDHCTFVGGFAAVLTDDSGLSTTFPVTVNNCVIDVNDSNVAALEATTSGQIVEDYNYIQAVTARSNVSAGAHSVAWSGSNPPGFLGYEWQTAFRTGRAPRPALSLYPGSNVTALLGGTGSFSSTDITGKNRPEGWGATGAQPGAHERHNTFVVDSAPPSGVTSKAYRGDGPGSHELIVPVDATSTTINFKMQFDSNYTGTNYPQIQIVNGEEAGVTAQTITGTVASNGAWQLMSFVAFTPARKGEITLRLVSRSGGATGKCYFADYQIF